MEEEKDTLIRDKMLEEIKAMSFTDAIKEFGTARFIVSSVLSLGLTVPAAYFLYRNRVHDYKVIRKNYLKNESK